MTLLLHRLYAMVLHYLSSWDEGGGCLRCWLSWKKVSPHYTGYKSLRECSSLSMSCHEDLGSFVFIDDLMYPLCIGCWESLNQKDRENYYKMVWLSWEKHCPGYADWFEIKKSVFEDGLRRHHCSC